MLNIYQYVMYEMSNKCKKSSQWFIMTGSAL